MLTITYDRCTQQFGLSRPPFGGSPYLFDSAFKIVHRNLTAEGVLEKKRSSPALDPSASRQRSGGLQALQRTLNRVREDSPACIPVSLCPCVPVSLCPCLPTTLPRCLTPHCPVAALATSIRNAPLLRWLPGYLPCLTAPYLGIHVALRLCSSVPPCICTSLRP